MMVVWVSFLATITILTDIPTGWLGGSSIISNMSKSKRFENQVSSIKNIGVPSPLSSSRQHRGFETFSLRDPNLNWYSYKMGSYELRLGKPYIYIYNKQGFLTSVKPIYKGIYKGYWFLDTYLVDCPRTKSVSFYNSTQARISGGEAASFPGKSHGSTCRFHVVLDGQKTGMFTTSSCGQFTSRRAEREPWVARD